MRTATWLVLGGLASACARQTPAADATAAPAAEASGVEARGSGAAAGELEEVSAALAANASSLAALGVDMSTPSRVRLDDDRKSREESNETTLEDGSKRKDSGGDDDAKPTSPAPDLDVSTTRPTARPSRPGTTPAPKASARAEPAPQAEPSVAAGDEPVACGRICELAGVACDLAQRICMLAKRHPGDARYADVCWNAERQCEQASDACADCTAC